MSAAVEGRVHVTHPDAGGEALIADDEAVVEHYRALGWVVSDEVPAHLDPDHQGDPDPAAEAAADDPATAPGEDDDPASADEQNEGVIERG